MLIRTYMYPVVRVDVVTLEPNETVTFDTKQAGKPFGTMVVAGYLAPTADPLLAADMFDWKTPLGWAFFPDWERPREHEFQAGPIGAQWVCLSRTRDGDRSIEAREIDGTDTLPAGWGMVIAEGSVAIDGQAGGQGNYFAPRDADTPVAGTAHVLLVR
jgi:hypothetical protein